MKATAFIALSAMAIIAFSGCKSAKDAAGQTVAAPDVTMQARPVGGPTANAMPKAVVYKTNGDYSANVAVNLNAAGQLVSYPAPTDVTVNSEPVAVGDGWLLDRRGGVGVNTAFLDYTYAQYAKLAEAPSPQELMKHIIPGAKVTETKQLPILQYEAIQNPSLVKKYLDK